MWVLAIIARPYTWWRIGLVAAMGAGFLLVLAVPVAPGLLRAEAGGRDDAVDGGRHRGGGGGRPGVRLEVGRPALHRVRRFPGHRLSPVYQAHGSTAYFTSTKSPVALTAGVVVVPAKL